MAGKQNQLATLLRQARAGLDQYLNAISTIQNKDWDDGLAEHHRQNLSDGRHRVERERAYVHDVLLDPLGKKDL